MEILRYAVVFPFSEVIRPIRVIESWTGFYMRTASVMKGFRKSCFRSVRFTDRDLRTIAIKFIGVSEPCETSKMECFAKTIKNRKL